MAEILRYVNTASTAGGDGTTNATVGANRAYASLKAWNAAEVTDLVAAGDTHKVLCSGTAADTDAVNVSGWTTGVANYITIEANSSDVAGRNPSAIWSTNHYRLISTTTESTLILTIAHYTRLINLQLEGTDSVINNRRIIQLSNSDSCLIDSCKLLMGRVTNSAWNMLEINSATIGVCVKNCLIDGNSAANGIGFNNLTSGTKSWFYNNTVVNCANDGINGGAPSKTVAKNNLAYNNGSDYAGNFEAASDYNAAQDGTATGGVNDRVSQTFLFVNAGAGDYTLLDTDTGAFDLGVDLSADVNCPVTHDNINKTRPQYAAFDIGAFETFETVVVPGAGGSECGFGFYSRGLGLGIGLGLGSAGCYGHAGATADVALQMTVKTDNAGTSTNTQFTLPLHSGSTYDFNIDWGDGNVERIQSNVSPTHEYGVAGTYKVRLGGTNNTFPRIEFNNTGDKDKLLSVDSWGNIAWTSFSSAFWGCSNCTSLPNTSVVSAGITTMASAFREMDSLTSVDLSQFSDMPLCTSITYLLGASVNVTSAVLNGMDTQAVTNFGSVFRNNGALTSAQFDELDTSSATSYNSMFVGCTLLDPDVSGFDFSLCTNADAMMENSAFGNANYDLLLVALDAQTLQSGVSLHAGEAQYSSGGPEVSRTNIVTEDEWVITDGGPAADKNEWVGTTADASLGSNWSLGHVPDSTEVAVFDENNTPCTVSALLDTLGVYISGDYTNTVTFNNGSGMTTRAAGYYQVGGTVDASADLTGNWNHGRFLLYAGTFSAPALMKSSNVTYTFRILAAATFTHNNGTLESDGSSSQFDLNGTTVYNVTGFAANPLATVSIQSNVDVVNKWHTPSGSLTGADGTVVTLQGDLQTGNNSSGNNNGLVFELNGTGAQEVYKDKLGATGGKIPRIKINKSAGTVTFWDELVLKNAGGLTAWEYVQGTVDFTTNSAKVFFNGFATTITDATTAFYDVRIATSNNNVTTALAAAIDVDGVLDVDSVLVTNGHTVDVAGNMTLEAAGDLQADAATFNIGGNFDASLAEKIVLDGGEVFNVTGDSTINGVVISPASKWDLHVSGVNNDADSCTIGWCDASGFTQLTATNSTDGSNNTNVSFV